MRKEFYKKSYSNILYDFYKLERTDEKHKSLTNLVNVLNCLEVPSYTQLSETLELLREFNSNICYLTMQTCIRSDKSFVLQQHRGMIFR